MVISYVAIVHILYDTGVVIFCNFVLTITSYKILTQLRQDVCDYFTDLFIEIDSS